MKKYLKTLLLTLCLGGLIHTAQAQTNAELQEKLKQAENARNIAMKEQEKAQILAKEALEAKLQAEKAQSIAIIAEAEANKSKLQALKELEKALQALEVAKAEKAILEKKVAELTKNKKK